MADMVAVLDECKRDKSLVSQYTARRTDKAMKLASEIGFARRQIEKWNPNQIEKVSESSVRNALLEGAYSGLSFNPMHQHLYLIPRWNKNLNCFEADIKVSYRGMLSKVQKSSALRGPPQAKLVYDDDPVFDVFTTAQGGTEVQHQEARQRKGQITHAYCIAWFKEGGHHVEVMDRTELDQIKNKALESKEGGHVWKTYPGEMMKKTVMRRAWKWWPKDEALDHLMDVIDRTEPMTFENDPGGDSLSEDQINSLHAMLVENGLEAKKADKWLNRMAKRYSASSIENVQTKHYDRIKDELKAYLAQRNEAANGTA